MMNQTPLSTASSPGAEPVELESTMSELHERGRIVIADDDPATRSLLCHVLTKARFSIQAYDNGQLACAAVRRDRPDVVLLDWAMPIMDGLRAAKLLKSDVATRAIPIVMITTHSQIEDRNLALEVGVQDFVTKPFDVRELIACIDQQMRWKAIIGTARAVGRRGPGIETCERKRRAKSASTNCPLRSAEQVRKAGVDGMVEVTR